MTETNADFQMDWDNIRIFLSTDRSVHRSLAIRPKDSTKAYDIGKDIVMRVT
jgi:hypothetical protein